jgi:hypothetical protein
MATISNKPSIAKFRPASKEDFSKYARNLSAILEEPVQKAQEILARIYGYADLHELQVDLQKPCESPGPYDEEWMARVVSKDKSEPMIDLGRRENIVLSVVAKFKGVTVNDLNRRFWDAREIGLFQTPGGHRKAFQQVRDKHKVIMGTEGDGETLSVFDYASIDATTEGEVVAYFTALGKAIYDAVTEIIPDEHNSSERILEGAERGLSLHQKHPNNPWVLGVYLASVSRILFQSQWDEFWDSNKRPFDADPRFKRYAKEYALELLPLAKKAVRLFSLFYGAHKKRAADHRLVSFNYEFGSDTFYWPATLFWGGKIALNAGEDALAYRWLSAHRKIVESDSFGARYYLSTLRLNRGRGSVSRLFTLKGPERTGDAWAYLAASAESFAHGDEGKAASLFSEAMTLCLAVAEPFAGRDDRLAGKQIMSNHRTPAHIQEFMYYTQPYWDKHPESMSFYRRIASNAAVREAVRRYHLKDESMIGIMLAENRHRDVNKEEEERRLLAKEVRKAVDAVTA